MRGSAICEKGRGAVPGGGEERVGEKEIGVKKKEKGGKAQNRMGGGIMAGMILQNPVGKWLNGPGCPCVSLLGHFTF